MNLKMVNVKLDEKMLIELDNAVNDGLYASRTEFIRESIRKNLLEAKKKEFFKDLAILKSKIKNKKESPILSNKDREKALKELLNKKNESAYN